MHDGCLPALPAVLPLLRELWRRELAAVIRDYIAARQVERTWAAPRAAGHAVTIREYWAARTFTVAIVPFMHCVELANPDPNDPHDPTAAAMSPPYYPGLPEAAERSPSLGEFKLLAALLASCHNDLAGLPRDLLQDDKLRRSGLPPSGSTISMPLLLAARLAGEEPAAAASPRDVSTCRDAGGMPAADLAERLCHGTYAASLHVQQLLVAMMQGAAQRLMEDVRGEQPMHVEAMHQWLRRSWHLVAGIAHQHRVMPRYASKAASGSSPQLLLASAFAVSNSSGGGNSSSSSSRAC